jgi:hypothetical protein
VNYVKLISLCIHLMKAFILVCPCQCILSSQSVWWCWTIVVIYYFVIFHPSNLFGLFWLLLYLPLFSLNPTKSVSKMRNTSYRKAWSQNFKRFSCWAWANIVRLVLLGVTKPFWWCVCGQASMCIMIELANNEEKEQKSPSSLSEQLWLSCQIDSQP